MGSRLDDITGRISAVLTEARDIAGQAEKEDRDFTDDERSLVSAKMKEASDLKAQAARIKGDADILKAVRDLGDTVGVGQPDAKPEAKSWPDRDGDTLGDRYVKSDEFQALIKSAPGGHFGRDHRVQSQPAGFRSLLPETGGAKTLVTGASATSGGPFVLPDQLGLQVGLGAFQRPLRIRDLVTRGTTQSDSIEYIRVTSATNNAAVVAEATNTSTGTKPESALATVKITENVKTIAHWIPITKRALSDAAQMRTLIDNFLIYGVEEELDDQMVTGDAQGENFSGVATVSGVQPIAFSTDILTTLRKAITAIRVTGRSVPNGFVLNPADIETIDLLQDNEGQYFYGGPAAGGGVNTLWRVPVVDSEAVPAGTGYLGDWRKAVLWDREQATITTTDSHSDWFVKNIVAILAEGRFGFGILQPSAFAEIDLTA